VSRLPDSLPAFIRSEFALVEIALVAGASGPLLRISDVPGGKSVCLDALELEGLCWLTSEQRRGLLDPEQRWTDAPPGSAGDEPEQPG
jgi:hypothetical protein